MLNPPHEVSHYALSSLLLNFKPWERLQLERMQWRSSFSRLNLEPFTSGCVVDAFG